MAPVVRCAKCGVEYETSASSTAIRWVRRCDSCGKRALEVVDSDEAPHAAGAEEPGEASGEASADDDG